MVWPENPKFHLCQYPKFKHFHFYISLLNTGHFHTSRNRREREREKEDYLISKLIKVYGNVGYNLSSFGMYIYLLKSSKKVVNIIYLSEVEFYRGYSLQKYMHLILKFTLICVKCPKRYHSLWTDFSQEGKPQEAWFDMV